MRFNIFAALAIFCGLVLTACGGKPEEQIVGTWKIDADAMKAEMLKDPRFKDMPEEAKAKAMEQGMKMMGSMTAEITKDGKITMNMGKDMKTEGTYKVTATNGKVVTLETTMDGKTENIEVTVDGSSIQLKGPKGPAMTFKK